jgi:hypothetical protein
VGGGALGELTTDAPLADGWGILVLSEFPRLWPGAVTPGIASIGPTCEPAEAGGLAEAAAFAAGVRLAEGGDVCAAVAFGWSGSEAGGSSGGGSWATAKLAPATTIARNRANVERNIPILSRVTDARGMRPLNTFHRSSGAAEIRFFSREAPIVGGSPCTQQFLARRECSSKMVQHCARPPSHKKGSSTDSTVEQRRIVSTRE